MSDCVDSDGEAADDCGFGMGKRLNNSLSLDDAIW